MNSYVQQNQINKFDNDSDSYTMVIQLEDWKNSTLISQVFIQRNLLSFTSRFRYFRKSNWSYPQKGQWNLGLVVCITHKGPLTAMERA